LAQSTGETPSLEYYLDDARVILVFSSVNLWVLVVYLTIYVNGDEWRLSRKRLHEIVKEEHEAFNQNKRIYTS